MHERVIASLISCLMSLAGKPHSDLVRGNRGRGIGGSKKGVFVHERVIVIVIYSRCIHHIAIEYTLFLHDWWRREGVNLVGFTYKHQPC